MGTRILRLTPDLLIQFLNGTIFQDHIIHGIPPDARILGIDDRIHFSTQEIAILLESSTWSPISPGSAIPLITLTSSPKSHD